VSITCERFSVEVKVYTVRILMALAVMYSGDIEQMDEGTAFLDVVFG
jgi:hypothetical protein